MSLSDKEFVVMGMDSWLKTEDVKEFIKNLKYELDEHWDKFDKLTIDKLAGEKLNK